MVAGVDRRAVILAAATEVFAERGYDGASVRVVAERSGVAKGHLTYYFAVKDDLLFAVVDALHDEFLALASGWARRPADAHAALAGAVTQHVLLVCDRRAATQVSYENFRQLSEERQGVVLAKRDSYEQRLRALVRAASRQAGRSPSSAELDTRLILGMLNWPYTWWRPDGLADPEVLARRIVDLGLAAFRPDIAR